MRIRSIKPEFWRSDDVAALCIEDRLLFIGLWSYVDDSGVGEDKVPSICGDLFAPDMEADAPGVFARVRRGLQTLSDRGLIARYTVEGKRYLVVTGWKRHQRIDKPSKSRYPGPELADQEQHPDSGSTPGALASPPEIPAPGTEEPRNRGTEEPRSKDTDSSSPSDVDAKSETGKKPRRDQGTRLPDIFVVTPEMSEWAAQHAASCGDRDHQAFCDYWRAQPGAKGRKLDWIATWRNWMRREQERRTAANRNGTHKPYTEDRVKDYHASW